VGDVLGLARQHGRVAPVDAHVGAGVEAPIEPIEELRVREQQVTRFVARGISVDHRFPTAAGHVGQHGLVGHRARQAQRIDDRRVEALVEAHARAADCGTQRRVVYGDDDAQARLGVLCYQDLLVPQLLCQLECAHASLGPADDHAADADGWRGHRPAKIEIAPHGIDVEQHLLQVPRDGQLADRILQLAALDPVAHGAL